MDVVRRVSPRRRVVAPDLPGHGQSDRWRPPEEVSIELYRDAVGTVCALSKIDRAVLMGHSMGVLVALAAAAAWPERVAGLVLVNGGARLPVSPEVWVRLSDDFARFGKWLARLTWSPSTSRDLIERWGAVALTADQEITTADFRAAERFDATPLLPRIRAPTLVLGGEDDLMTPPSLTRALAAGIAGARAVVVPEAGHMLPQERPEPFFAELDAFLITAA